MPFLATDVEQGQVAGLNLGLNPIRAQEEAKRLPLETQKLQAIVNNDNLKTQKDTLEVQSMLKDEASSAKAKSAIQSFYNDPANKSMSVPDQQEALAQLVAGQGNFKLADTLFTHSQAARDRIARNEELKLQNDDHALDRIHSYGANLTPDNIDQTIMAMQKDGVMKPEEASLIGDTAHKALAAGPEMFDKWKQAFLDSHSSVKAKTELAKENQYKETNRLAQDRIDANERAAEGRNNTLVAAITSRDQTAIDTVSSRMYTSGEATVRDAQTVIKNNRIARDKLGPPPRKAMWGDDSEKRKDWDKESLDLEQSDNDAKSSLEGARKDMVRARALMSPRIAAALGEPPSTKVPSNKPSGASEGKIKDPPPGDPKERQQIIDESIKELEQRSRLEGGLNTKEQEALDSLKAENKKQPSAIKVADAPDKPTDRKKDTKYNTPKGILKWTGTGWIKP